MDIRHAGIRRIADASDLGTVTNAQVLQYNSATKKFDGVTLSLSDSTISGILPIAKGGTGVASASAARTGLGLAIGTDVQAYDADLLAIAALSHADGDFMVSNGSAWVAESGATARASLGLTGTVITTDNLSDITSVGTLSAAAITQTGTSGNGLYVLRDLASGSTDSPLVRINNTNASDDQTAVEIAQDGSGAILDLKSDGVTVLKIPAGMGNGTDGQVLTTDGDGVTSWQTVTSEGAAESVAADNITAGDAAITISTTTGAVNITPASGSAIVLDGAINIDAGVVTGATSITSTAFVGNLTGDVTGNTSGTALTVTQAAQTAITSVGTLTTLQVDNIKIDGSTISTTAGTDLNITPLAGQQIVLDGAVVIDAGVVTGATSITSTAFVGGNLVTEALTVQAASGNSGYIYLSADAGEDNSDLWRMSVADGGNFAIASQATGSWVNKMTLTSGTMLLEDALAVAGNASVGGDLTISGDDLFMATNTSGYVLVADGTNYNPVAVSGDATLASNGAVTIANNAVSLAKMAGITRGSIIIGDASGDPAALAIGSDTYVLTSDGTDIAWAAAASGGMIAFILEDDDGTEVSISNAEEVKFIGSGITTNWTDTTPGSDGDPFDMTFTVDAAQTGITSLLATDIKIGEDDQTKIDFETADEIHFYAANVEQVYLADNIFGPQSDSDVDLGSTGVRWKDAYVDSITVTGEIDGDSLDIEGNADINGTLEADAITVGGTALSSVIAGTTVVNATIAATISIADNESTDHNNHIPFIAGGDGGVGGGIATINHDGDLHYNPSSGTVTATIFKGNIDAVDGDFDGTLEADAITVGGVALATYIRDTVGTNMLSSNTESGIAVTYDTSNDNIDFAISAAQTGITSILATDLKIGEDDQTKIDFETADEIHFYAANVEQVYLADNIFGPQSDSDVDLGATGVRWKDAFVDSITVTGEIDGASLDISGDADIDGTLEADAITIGGTALASYIAGTTVILAAVAATVTVADTESTNEDDNITFVRGGPSASGNVSIGSDGDFHYNPSSGTVTATIFKGNIDAVDGDFDGTLEADAITVGGTNIVTGSLITTLGTISAGVWQGTAIASAYIADNAITGTKIALGSDATGDIMYYNGTDYVRLAAAQDGYVLTATGVGAAPAWEAAAGGGSGTMTTVMSNGVGVGGADIVTLDFSSEFTVGETPDTEINISMAAAQTAITSLGTLTALTVDDVAINGKVITMTGSTDDTAVLTVGTNGTLSIVTTDAVAAAANVQITADGTVDIDSAGLLTLDSGAAINIEPAVGSAILLDGTISIDAGVVTGATSITSTAFVGDITGNADTVTNGVYTTNNLSVMAATTSAQLAGVISDETGSGALVFGTSPTLVTPALGTPSALVGTNITGTAASLTVGAVTNGVYTTDSGTVSNTMLANSSVTVSDGSNTSPVALGGTMTFSGTTNEVTVAESAGTVTIGLPDDVTISGNLTVSGDTTTVNTATLSVEDPLIILASGNNSADVVDVGFYGLYDTSGTLDLYAGLFRDANDSGKFKLFKDLQAAPTTTVNTSGTGYTKATLVADIEGALTGNADTVTTNANLTGHITSTGNASVLGSFTSAQLATAVTNETGSGALVFATSPTLVTPALGTPSALVGTNISGTAANLTAGTVTTNANLTGHITSTGNAAVLGSFTSAQLATAVTNETGSGVLVFATSPTLVTPALGTPSALVGTNISGTAANLTAGTVTNGVYTTNNLSVMAATTSAQLAGVISDETGSGTLVFATSPTLVTPALGTPSALVGTNISGTAASLTAGALNSSIQNAVELSPHGTSAGNTGEIRFLELAANGANYVGFKAPDTIGLSDSQIYVLPTADGSGGQQLTTDGSGTLSWAAAATSSGTPTVITVADTTDTTSFVALFESATGDLGPKTDAGITYNAGTGTLTATAFAGPLTGNVTGNTSGTALTVTQAAQTAITSLGTLTALTVDDVVVDGKVITMTGSSSDTAVITVGTNGALSIVTTDAAATAANIQITADGTVDIDSAGVLTLDSGAAINIEPAVGSAILLDGTISVDAGVVTGATSITSTAFVGALTGTASIASAVVVVDESSDTTCFPLFASGATSGQSVKSGSNLTFNASSGLLTATLLAGDLTGAVTGNADTATALAAGRTIGMTGDVVWTSASFTGAGNVTGSATIQANSVDGTMIAIGSDAAGDIMYNNGTDYVRLAKGSDDEVLTLASGLPSWATASSAMAFILEDDDGTEVSVSNAEEVKFIGSGITTNWTDTTPGSDGDPFDLTFTVDAAQTGITSLLATDIKIGEDDQTKIDFETVDEIHFYAANVEQVYVADNIFGPQSDSDVDLGSTGVRWKDAFVDSITVTGEVDGASLDISGNADIDGTLEADAYTVDGVALNEYIADTVGAMVGSNTESGITVAYQDGDNTLDFTVGTLNQDTTGTAAIATTVTITDNENTNEDNAIIFTAGGDVDGGNIGLESDGDLLYNPSTGTVTATIFKGNIDAVDGDFDGTLEADAITVGGTALNTVIAGVTVTNATTAAVATAVTITDNENTNEDNAIIFTAGGDVDGGNIGLESDGDLIYNPSTGTVTATIFKGNIDAVDGDFDGTLEADAITLGGTALGSLYSPIAGSSSILTVGTIGTGTWAATDVAVAHGGTGASSAGDARTNLGLGSIATKTYNATMGDNANIPDGAAIKVYGDTNWGGGGDITAVVAGDGLSGGATSGSATVTLDLNELTAAVVADGDFIAIIDTNDGNASRKEAVHDLATLFAGTGLTATNSAIAVDTLNQDTTGTAAIATTVTITDNENTNEDNAIIFTAGGDVDGGNIGLESDGDLIYNPSTGTVTATIFKGNIDAVDGDFDGTLEADAITVGGTALASVIAGTTVSNATTAAVATTVTITDNESTNEDNAIIFTAGGDVDGGNIGLESDGDLHYNPSTGTVTATIFKGNIDAVDGDFDGTLEADAITVGGTALNTVIAGVTVTNATTAAVATTVTITDNESTSEENAIIFTAGGDVDGGNIGLESDGTMTYNPSTGTVTATIFKGNVDAVDGDFDGTLEADAITLGGTALGSLYSPIAGSSSILTVGTIATGTWEGTTIAVDQGGTGATTLNNLITLGTHTTGNYVATIADAGNSAITVANSGSETAAITLDIADNAVGIAELAGIARGKIIVGDASGNPALLAAGDEDQVLTIDASGDAVWAAASGGGGSGDITGVTLAGDSSTAQDLTANVNLTLAGGNGITTAGDGSATISIALDAALTTVTSLLATDIKIGEDDQTKIDFETADEIHFYAANVHEVTLAANELSPNTSDGIALGTGSKMWSDLFLASAGVINFNNGDVTLTHSSNAITVGGGKFSVQHNTGELALFERITGDGNAYITVDATNDSANHAQAQLRLTTGVDGDSRVYFGDTDDVDRGCICYDHADETLTIKSGTAGGNTGSTTAITIDTNQATTFAGSINQGITSATEDATVVIDLSDGNYFNITLGADVTDIDFTNGTDGQRFLIRFTQPGGANHSIAYNAVTHDQDGGGSPAAVTIKWAGGVTHAMTRTNAKADTIGFIINDENAFDAFIVGQNL